MDKHFTIMVIPEREKKVRSIKIPGMLFRSLSFVLVAVVFLIGILMYDYWQILQRIHENKQLDLENRELKRHIQTFQMKVNGLAQDIERIKTFEEKLRIITGLQGADKTQALIPESEGGEMMDNNARGVTGSEEIKKKPETSSLDFKNIDESKRYTDLKRHYQKKISENLGFKQQLEFTKNISKLLEMTYRLSEDFALFDVKYERIKGIIGDLEKKVHSLDQYLLDKSSLLNSTPSLLPTNGWVTSYYGVRLSPYSNKRKMHEGLDVGAPYGANIMASADGVVTFSGHKPGFGKHVLIDHGYGVETIYAHAQKLVAKSGESVRRGQLIAKVGSTGQSTGPHLHYEVRVNGIAVDPLYFVLD